MNDYNTKYKKYKKKYMELKFGGGEGNINRYKLKFVGHGWDLYRDFRDDSGSVFNMLDEPGILYEGGAGNNFANKEQDIPDLLLTTFDKIRNTDENNGLYLYRNDNIPEEIILPKKNFYFKVADNHYYKYGAISI